jgi:hypothetical protein
MGGELVEEFRALTVPGEGSRRREVDGVIATDGPRRQHPRGTPLPLHGRDVVVCQAKAGQLELGVLLSALHREVGGLLISRTLRSHTHFSKIQTAASGEPLRQADPDAIILPSRTPGEVTATDTLSIAAEEPVVLAYTCPDPYMTAMGRAVFGGEIARRLLGLAHVISYLCYSKDNAVLHGLMDELPHVACR